LWEKEPEQLPERKRMIEAVYTKKRYHSFLIYNGVIFYIDGVKCT